MHPIPWKIPQNKHQLNWTYLVQSEACMFDCKFAQPPFSPSYFLANLDDEVLFDWLVNGFILSHEVDTCVWGRYVSQVKFKMKWLLLLTFTLLAVNVFSAPATEEEDGKFSLIHKFFFNMQGNSFFFFSRCFTSFYNATIIIKPCSTHRYSEYAYKRV